MPDYKQLRLVAKAIVVSGSAYGGSSPSSGIVSRWLVDKSIHVGHAKHLLTLIWVRSSIGRAFGF